MDHSEYLPVNFFPSLILTTWEILIAYRLLTCLPNALPVFSLYLFIYFILLVFIICFIDSFVASFINPFMCPLSLTTKQIHFSCPFCTLYTFWFITQLNALLSVYQQYLQKTHHHFIGFLHLTFDLPVYLVYPVYWNCHHMANNMIYHGYTMGWPIGPTFWSKVCFCMLYLTLSKVHRLDLITLQNSWDGTFKRTLWRFMECWFLLFYITWGFSFIAFWCHPLPFHML